MTEADTDTIPPADVWTGLAECCERVTRAVGSPETAERRIRARLEDRLLRFRFIDEADPALLFTTDPTVLFRYKLPYGYAWRDARINFAAAQASWEARVEAAPLPTGMRNTNVARSIHGGSHRFPKLHVYRIEVLVPAEAHESMDSKHHAPVPGLQAAVAAKKLKHSNSIEARLRPLFDDLVDQGILRPDMRPSEVLTKVKQPYKSRHGIELSVNQKRSIKRAFDAFWASRDK